MFNLQNHPIVSPVERLVNLERGRECFVCLFVLLVYVLISTRNNTLSLDLSMVTKYIEHDEVKVKELSLTLHKLRTRNPHHTFFPAHAHMEAGLK